MSSTSAGVRRSNLVDVFAISRHHSRTFYHPDLRIDETVATFENGLKTYVLVNRNWLPIDSEPSAYWRYINLVCVLIKSSQHLFGSVLPLTRDIGTTGAS